MTEHILTLTESGSWQREVQINPTDGSIDEGSPESMSTEMLVDAECSCGEQFQDLQSAYGHLREV